MQADVEIHAVGSIGNPTGTCVGQVVQWIKNRRKGAPTGAIYYKGGISDSTELFLSDSKASEFQSETTRLQGLLGNCEGAAKELQYDDTPPPASSSSASGYVAISDDIKHTYKKYSGPSKCASSDISLFVNPMIIALKSKHKYGLLSLEGVSSDGAIGHAIGVCVKSHWSGFFANSYIFFDPNHPGGEQEISEENLETHLQTLMTKSYRPTGTAYFAFDS